MQLGRLIYIQPLSLSGLVIRVTASFHLEGLLGECLKIASEVPPGRGFRFNSNSVLRRFHNENTLSVP